MSSDLPENSIEVIHRLLKAGNEHNLPGLIACMAANYQSGPPAHPDRAFQGREHVEKNWSAMFEEIPDFRMELLDLAFNGDRVWIECKWSGTLKDQTPFHWRGVTIFTVEGNEITAGRLYMEPVQESGPGIDETMKKITKKII